MNNAKGYWKNENNKIMMKYRLWIMDKGLFIMDKGYLIMDN